MKMPKLKLGSGKPKIKIPDFFKKDAVVFLDSGHKLRLSNGYYRCDLNCRGKCKNRKEGQLKKGNLERNFSRLAKHFSISKAEADKINKKLMRAYFVDILIGVDESVASNQDTIRENIDKMEKDREHGRFVKRDVKETVEEFAEISKKEQPLILFSYVLGIIATFSAQKGERWLGRALAAITKHVYISDGGTEIKKIELESWGWYILKLIDRNVPYYLQDIKDHEINIINDPADPVIGKPLNEAIEYFKSTEFNEALHNENTAIVYSLFSYMKMLFKPFFEGDPEVMQKAYLDFIKEFQTNPIFQAAQMGLSLGGGEIKF